MKNENNERIEDEAGEVNLTTDEDSADTDIAKLKEKLVKAKSDLRECQREKKEYLDGWQRSKADYINFKREVAERDKGSQTRTTERVIKELLPVLESMDKARAWVKDLTPIETQFLTILKEFGLEQFGKVGEAFDPSKYESVGMMEVDESDKEDIIMEVVSVGYIIAGKVLKPATVKIGVFKKQTFH